MDLFVEIQELCWADVPTRAVELAEKSAGVTQEARKAIANLPQDGFLDLWYDSDQDKLLLNVGDWMETETCQKWKAALEPLAAEFQWEAELGGPDGIGEGGNWTKIAMRPFAARAFIEKQGESKVLNTAARGLGYLPGYIPTAPNPLVAGLTSGLLGAGLGYGAGWLGEQLMPDRWEKGRLSRSLALMGGLGGVALPAVWAGNNIAMGKNWNSGEAMANAGSVNSVDSHMPYKYNPGKGFTKNPGYTGQLSLHTMPELEQYSGKTGQELFIESLEKQSFFSQTGHNGPWPEISVPDFHAAVNLDPRVKNRLPPATRAAATGLVTGASAIRGGAQMVSPVDVGRMAAGMGSGYLSGMAVGKVLGALTGLPQGAQNHLRNTGMWAGALANVLPMAFGR